MTNPLALSYGQQLEDLTAFLTANWQWPSPDGGFALHVFRAVGLEPPFAAGDMELSEACRRRLGEGPILAAVGYVHDWPGGKEPDIQADWVGGLARLATKQAFPRDRESFFYRPTELLGICLGAHSCHVIMPQDRRWLERVVLDGTDHLATAQLWALLLGAYAAHTLDVALPSARLPEDGELAIEELGLLIWLQSACPKLVAALRLAGREARWEEALLRRTMLAPLPLLDVGRTAVLRFALEAAIQRFITSSSERYWQQGKEARDAVELVQTLCSRFHLFALQIEQRHASRSTISFGDEYDVQDALHALLKLHFADVRVEEWTPSCAGNASRTDFLLKREQVVIEVKMTRRNLGQKEIADQLIIDKERYRTHPDCKTLVCFIYDPDHLCTNPAALEYDLSSDGTPLRVVVIVAPRGT